MRRSLAIALFLALACSAVAQGYIRAPRVELPYGSDVSANRPFRIRVISSDNAPVRRVRAPGTPWALPVGKRGDEFILQMPAVVVLPLDVTVERDQLSDQVRVPATLLTADAASALPRDPFDPFLLGPDPELFAAMEEVAIASPRLDQSTATFFLLLGGLEVALALVLAFRRDRPWIRAAWLAGPAVVGAIALVPAAAGAPLVAVPFAVDGRLKVVYVRVHALRDGSGTLEGPRDGDEPMAVIRYSADDRSVEEVEAGTEVRLRLRAGESRVVGYRCGHEKRQFLLPGTMPPVTTPGPKTHAWLASRGQSPSWAMAGAHPLSRPVSSDIRVLPGLEVSTDDLPTK